MKKAVVVASVASMIYQFNRHNIQLLRNLGYKVIVATNFEEPGNISLAKSRQLIKELEKEGVDCVNIPFARFPFSKDNLKAYNVLKNILDDAQVTLVHAHSPVGGVISRLLTIRRRKIRLIYTAHGFHFFKGASKKNWVIYYPIEKILSYVTDDLITINSEDYQFAIKKLNAKRTHKINGIGIDLEKFTPKKSFKRNNNQFQIISIGELNHNKNHRLVIEAIAQSRYREQILYDICGEGVLRDDIQELIVSYGLQSQVHLLGYRDDVNLLLEKSDIFVFPSYREGLPVSIMEAMAIGLPILASDIRGNHDLVEHGKGGYLFTSGQLQELISELDTMIEHREKLACFGVYNREKIKEFSTEYVDKQMKRIYLLGKQ